MSRGVRRHYPVEHLPEGLRSGVASTVTLIKERDRVPGPRLSLDDLAIRAGLPVSEKDPAARITAFRNEWN